VNVILLLLLLLMMMVVVVTVMTMIVLVVMMITRMMVVMIIMMTSRRRRRRRGKSSRVVVVVVSIHVFQSSYGFSLRNLDDDFGGGQVVARLDNDDDGPPYVRDAMALCLFFQCRIRADSVPSCVSTTLLRLGGRKKGAGLERQYWRTTSEERESNTKLQLQPTGWRNHCLLLSFPRCVVDHAFGVVVVSCLTSLRGGKLWEHRRTQGRLADVWG